MPFTPPPTPSINRLFVTYYRRHHHHWFWLDLHLLLTSDVIFMLKLEFFSQSTQFTITLKRCHRVVNWHFSSLYIDSLYSVVNRQSLATSKRGILSFSNQFDLLPRHVNRCCDKEDVNGSINTRNVIYRVQRSNGGRLRRLPSNEIK